MCDKKELGFRKLWVRFLQYTEVFEEIFIWPRKGRQRRDAIALHLIVWIVEGGFIICAIGGSKSWSGAGILVVLLHAQESDLLFLTEQIA